MFCQRSLGPRGSVLFESRKVWGFGFRKALSYSALGITTGLLTMRTGSGQAGMTIRLYGLGFRVSGLGFSVVFCSLLDVPALATDSEILESADLTLQAQLCG